jgi:hypothetical protein
MDAGKWDVGSQADLHKNLVFALLKLIFWSTAIWLYFPQSFSRYWHAFCRFFERFKNVQILWVFHKIFPIIERFFEDMLGFAEL